MSDEDLRDVQTFQFTCPSRSTTVYVNVMITRWLVSIHVPLAEHDQRDYTSAAQRPCFNSRAPRGARLPGRLCAALSVLVSIHVPLAEHDRSLLSDRPDVLVSIHVPLAEHDSAGVQPAGVTDGFNSRAPRGARLYLLIPGTAGSPFQFTCPSRSTTSFPG